MRRIVLVMGGAALLAALVAAIRCVLSRESALARPLSASDSVVIERLPEDVFAYVSDLQNIPEWVALSGEMRKETEGPPEVDARYTADLTFLGRRLVIPYEVSTYEPPRLFVFRSLGGPLHGEKPVYRREQGRL
jgi:Polyketide cyclase / dehydrase and lipid transport